jgi:hypothetical protein
MNIVVVNVNGNGWPLSVALGLHQGPAGASTTSGVGA